MKKIQERINEKKWDSCYKRNSGKILTTELENIKQQAIFEMLDELAERDELKIQMVDDSKRGYLDNVPFSFSKNWRAKKGKYYFAVSDGGVVCRTIDRYDEHDDFRYNIGNYYKMEGEAQEALDLLLEQIEL